MRIPIPRKELVHRAAVIGIIAVCTFLGTSSARTTFLQRDFVIPGDQAEQFLASGKLPEKACISNLGSYIPPGVAWLEIPGLLLHRPLFLQLPAAIVLFILTLIGIYLLGKECAGPWTGCGAMALFGFYQNSLHWAQSIWPRGFPVCYVWIALFTLWWVKRRKPTYFFGALLVLLLGLSVHLELIFAAIPVALTWIWLRPPIGKWAAPLAVLCSLVVWGPYLHFEAGRHFLELRSQLFLSQLPRLNPATEFPGMIQQYDVRAKRFVPFDPAPNTEIYPKRSLLTKLKQAPLSAYANFYTSRLIGTMLFPIAAVFAACLGFAFRSTWASWAGERKRSIELVCLSLAVPWILLSLAVAPTFLFRQGGLLALQCVIACVGATFLLSLPRGRWIASFLILAWVIGDARMSGRIAATIARDGWAGRECAEAQLCDAVATESRGKPLHLGYFLVLGEMGVICDEPGEPTQKVGLAFDRYLRWRYGIDNQTKSMIGFSDGDQYRLVQPRNDPNNEHSYRFKTDLRGFAPLLQAGQFELWKRDGT
jgi:hypothetical protein